MRIRISNDLLPGWTSEWIEDQPGERASCAVYDDLGEYVGDVAVVARRRASGSTDYGWRPAGNARLKLTSKVEAVRRLEGFGQHWRES